MAVKRKYSLSKDKIDPRDWKFAGTLNSVAITPAVDLRSMCPPVYDQGGLGSCTANALAAAFQYDQIKQKIPSFFPSRLFIYYNERLLEGSVTEDVGATLRDGIKTLNQNGVCPESLWPYNEAAFASKPSTVAYSQAKIHTALQYYRVNVTPLDIKAALAAKLPVIAGMLVYSGFETLTASRTGIVPMPDAHQSLLGGHAVLIVGYNDTTKQFICRNSWGAKWGDKGYFYLPYTYATSRLMMDLWVVQSVK